MEKIYNQDKPLDITTRAVLYVTKVCNINCQFCYYRWEKNRNHTSLNEIRQTLELFKRDYNIEYVDITGGEPTIHPQINEIIKISLEIGIKPTVITNGQRADRLSNLIDEGLEDVLISIHGVGENHDKAVNHKGAFDKIIETISMMKNKKFSFRTNTVLTNFSCSEIDKLAHLFICAAPRIVNLISFNPYEGSLWNKKNNNDFQLSYYDQAESAKKIIDILDKADIWVNVRYMPLCFMKGYEKNVCNFLQLPYDPYEWEYLASNKSNKEQIENIRTKAKNSDVFGNTEKEKFYQFAMKHIIKDNKIIKACEKCSNFKVCDHIYPQYLKEYGENAYVPFDGRIIDDPMFYRKQDKRWSVLKNN